MAGVVLTIRFRTILTMTLVAAGVVLGALALNATRNVLAELVLAAAVACLVRPAVLWLGRRTRMGAAVAAVIIGLVLTVGALLGAEARAITSSAKELQHAVPDRIEKLQRDLPPNNRLRRFLVESDAVARVRHNIDGIPSRFILGTDSPAKGASQLGQILLVASLSAFMVTQAPKSLKSLVARLPASSRAGASARLGTGYRAGGAYVRRTLALGGACAAAGGLIAAGCGVPGAALLALWLGMWALIPKIGTLVGGLPLVGLAFGQGTAQGVGATIGLAIVIGAGEWSRRRWIEGPTVTVGALLSLVAVMTGMELARWPGAIVALLGVAALLAAFEAAPRPRRRPSLEDRGTPAAVVPASPPLVTDGDPGPRRVTVDIDTRSLVLTGVVVLSLLVAVALARSVPQALTRLAVGVLVALALNPLVDVVQRRMHVNRKGAVAVVVGGFIAGVAAFAVFALPRALQQGSELPKEVPHLVSQLDKAPLVGKTVRQNHLDERVRTFLDDLPHLLATRGKALEGAAKSAGDSLIAVSWMLLVLVGALLDGPAIAEWVKHAVSPARRPRVERLGSLTYQTVGRSAAGSAFTALLQGAVVLIIGLSFGVPLSPVLAANAAFWALVPQVGGLLAALPLILFGLTQGLGTGVAVGLLFLAWMLLNNHVLHAVIVGKAVHISALASLVAVLVGAALGGFVGAIIATPLAGVAHVLLASPSVADTPRELPPASGPAPPVPTLTIK